MKAIYKIDKIFIIVYSIIIFSVGIFLFFLSDNNYYILIITLLIELFYLLFSAGKFYKRLKLINTPFPEEWNKFIKTKSKFFNNIDDKHKKRFINDIKIFMSEFNVEGIKGEKIDTETKLLIAMGIATVLNGRPNWEPPIRDSIVVYPGRNFDENFQIGEGNYAGMAPLNGPMILSKDSLKASFENQTDGYNVLFHEIAHYFDWEDGEAGGVPAVRMLSNTITPWKKVIYEEWEKANKGQSFLGSYAGKNQAELFAVATEFFFEKPHLLRKKNPELYQLLKNFFNIDTEKLIPY
jgi:Mlc titration factor MtfA (ptsG expression regulator)